MSMEIIEDSVAHFLESKFIPRHLEDAGRKTIGKYRCVLNRTADYLGHQVCFKELSDDLISDLSAWLVENGMGKNQAKMYRQILRSLAADAQSLGYKTGWISSIDPLAEAKGAGNRRQKFKRDLRGPKARIRRKLAKAAALFANGFKLAEIGEKLGLPRIASTIGGAGTVRNGTMRMVRRCKRLTSRSRTKPGSMRRG